MTTQHAASSIAQSQKYRHRRRICVTEDGIVRDITVLGYICISDELNVKHMELFEKHSIFMVVNVLLVSYKKGQKWSILPEHRERI